MWTCALGGFSGFFGNQINNYAIVGETLKMTTVISERFKLKKKAFN